jgi:tetratricopeptide (TPR) repeat protein
MEQYHRQRPDDSLVWREYALRLQDTHNYSDAINVWSDYLSRHTSDIDGFKALFQCLIEQDTSGTNGRRLIRERFTLASQLQNRERALALSVIAGSTLEDSALMRSALDSLTLEFPNNRTGFQALGEQFYDDMTPVWTKAREKISYCDHFIRKYNNSYWQNEAYQFLLAAYAELILRDSLFFFIDRWQADVKDSPLPLLLGATWAMRLDTLHDRALNWAQKSQDMVRTYEFPTALDPMQREFQTHRMWIECREALIWAQWKSGLTDDALRLLYHSARDCLLDTEDDFTLAGLWTLGAWIYQSDSNTDSAKVCLVRALELGDRKNYWSQKADSLLGSMGIEDRLDLARKLLKYDGPVFTDVTEQVGLGGRRESRVAWGDYDNDGDDDLLLSGGVLFENTGKKFVNVSDDVGLSGGLNGGVWGDCNGDGLLDIYGTGNGNCGDKLFVQHADGYFEDVTERAGICDSVSSEGAAWADADNDGDLDLYVANYEKPGTLGSGTPDILYLNNGNGVFSRATDERGMSPPWGKPLCGRGVNWCDFDKDGDQDLFVSNYRLQENLLFVNDSNLSPKLKCGWFENRAPRYHVNGEGRDGWFGHTIGSEWGDLDNDGDFDLVSANLAHPRYIEFSNKTQILVNPGNGLSFEDERASLGVKYEETHSDPALADVNGDGYLDLYFTSIYENRRSFLYLSTPGEQDARRYKDVTYLAGVRTMNGWGCAFSDYDNDGDLDLVVGSGSGLRLFGNDSPIKPFLKVAIEDEIGNQQGIGVRIEVSQKVDSATDGNGKRIWIREIQGGKGTTSQHSLTQLFTGFDPLKPLELVAYPLGREPVHLKVTEFNSKVTLILPAQEEIEP